MESSETCFRKVAVALHRHKGLIQRFASRLSSDTHLLKSSAMAWSGDWSGEGWTDQSDWNDELQFILVATSA